MKQLILLMAGFAAFHAAAAGPYSAAEADFSAVCATAADSLPPVDTLANEPYLLADPMPSFNGNGTLDFCRWVQEHLRYPYEAVIYGIEGRVLASFVVEADGSVGSVRIIRSPHPVLSREVVRALAESPRWTPGSQNGEPVRVKYTVPVDFRIPAERKTASGPAQERNTTRR